jgi:hypothetical protein
MKLLVLGLALGLSLGAGGSQLKQHLDRQPELANGSCLLVNGELPVIVAEFDIRRQAYTMLIMGILPVPVLRVDVQDEIAAGNVEVMDCDSAGQ